MSPCVKFGTKLIYLVGICTHIYSPLFFLCVEFLLIFSCYLAGPAGVTPMAADRS